MDHTEVTQAFAALGHPVRLKATILLAGQPDGWPAGRLAQELQVRQNTFSSHIGVLQRANLVFSQRQGRYLVYRLNRNMAHSVLQHAVAWIGQR